MMTDFEAIFAGCERGDETNLFPEQQEAIDWLESHPYSALYADVGKGKTVMVETLIDRLLCRGYRRKILVIAPIRVCLRVWMREHRLWRHLLWFENQIELLRVADDDPRPAAAAAEAYEVARLLGDEPATARGKASRAKTLCRQQLRSELAQSERQIHVINQEAVDWLVKEWRALGQWPYRVVIFDEASRLRDHNSKVFRELKTVLPHIERFHELTASPSSQTYMYLFSQIYLLDKGERFGTHITPFRERYFSYNHRSREWSLRPGGAEAIEEKLADICWIMRREKKFQVVTRDIDLPARVLKQYREFEEGLVLNLAGGTVIDAVNSAVLSNKLLQFASGAVYDAENKAHVVHTEKIEELKSLQDELNGQRMMVAYWYKSTRDRLRRAFPRAIVLDREASQEEDWNRGKIGMLLVHPRSAGHGLNMQFGGHHLAVFDIFWPLELFLQLIGRLDRQGQTDTVMVHMLSVRRTMDQLVARKLTRLESAEDAMFQRILAIQRRLRGEAA